jgi:hypothetical protein
MIPVIPGATVHGELYPPDAQALLTQDMLEVELSNGVIIDVGWYPEHDPDGHYGIIVFKEDDPDTLLVKVTTPSFERVVRTVSDLAERFSERTAVRSRDLESPLIVANTAISTSAPTMILPMSLKRGLQHA